jgi:hypothetical protein
MRLTIELSTEESIALRRFFHGNEHATLEDAAVLALREYLISTGDLEMEYDLAEDSETVGSA